MTQIHQRFHGIVPKIQPMPGKGYSRGFNTIKMFGKIIISAVISIGYEIFERQKREHPFVRWVGKIISGAEMRHLNSQLTTAFQQPFKFKQHCREVRHVLKDILAKNFIKCFIGKRIRDTVDIMYNIHSGQRGDIQIYPTGPDIRTTSNI